MQVIQLIGSAVTSHVAQSAHHRRMAVMFHGLQGSGRSATTGVPPAIVYSAASAAAIARRAMALLSQLLAISLLPLSLCNYPQHQPQQHHHSHQHHYDQQRYQQHQQQLQQQQQQIQQQQSNHYPSYPQNNQPHYQSKPNYPVKAYQTQYPSAQPAPPQQHQHCDIPPDLWCDSPQAAQQCGVQRQCDSLRQRRSPLKISLIYEALCPYCQKFIANQLGTVFNQFRGQFELELVPWGNARILRDGSFSCNHGKKECDANKLQSCVLDILQVKGALPFIVCFERALGHSAVEPAMQHCSAFIRSQYRQIRQCFDGERGMQLQRAAAQKTMSTRPHPIMEVPYLLINDYSPSIDNNNLNVMLLPQLLNKWTKMYQGK